MLEVELYCYKQRVINYVLKTLCTTRCWVGAYRLCIVQQISLFVFMHTQANHSNRLFACVVIVDLLLLSLHL